MNHEVISAEELRRRLPRWWPQRAAQALARRLLKGLALDRINALYSRCYTCRGGHFAAAVLEDLGIRLEIDITPEAVRTLARYRTEHSGLIIVAGHPFGALDGVALLAWLTPLLPEFRMMANRILERVEPLRECLLTVDPVQADRHNHTALHQAYRHVSRGGALCLFPTGRVASWREVRHPESARWRPQVTKLIEHLRAPLLRVRWEGRNSLWFYLLGLLGWRVRTLRLPREVFARKNRVIKIKVEV
jgi:putative hemolysin